MPACLLTSGVVKVLRKMRTLRKGALVLVFLAFTLGGCRGARFDGTDYRDREVAFRLASVPPDLRALRSDDAKVAFQNDRAGSTIAISARCGVDSDDVPLRALVQHLFIQLTERQTISEKEFVLDGRAALEMEIEAYLDGVKRRFVVTVLKKDGCVYDFIHVDGGGSSSQLEASRADFRKLVAGFSTLD
jgi:hypothetical protein